MDGTSKYINLKTGPQGDGMPPGEQVGDILRWNGVYWIPVQLAQLVAPVVYHLSENGEVDGAVPAGHRLNHVTIINNDSVTREASVGFTEDGVELLDHEQIEAYKWIDIPVERLLSLTQESSLWFAAEGMISINGFTMIVETKLFYKT
ncbi:MAG: hypothetical protein NTW16_05000 [Bacteroidetes bacterium]|nr:hypothetical protein [Bacteroidota bacterium]